ncbi:MAG: chemotaxis protein CheX [Calditrichaeota bacterium]|nr:chemotaxis protein CheX [Calditrichota bacterium]
MSENQNRLETSLSSAVATTLENMTFEEIEVVDEPASAEISDDMIWAAVPILQPHEGELVVRVAPEYAKILAEEVFGSADEAISDAAVKDVIAEMANTIAGRFMNELVPSDEEFRLGLPNTGVGKFQEGSDQVTSILINVGEHPLVTSVIGNDFVKLTNE